MNMEFKTFVLNVFKGGTTAGNIINGDASPYGGSPDSYGDVIVQGAYTKDMFERGNVRPAFWSHEPSDLIGNVTLTDTPTALRAKFSLVPEVQRASEAIALAKALGPLLGISIGYETIKAHSKAGIRYLTEIRLYEVSLVSLPANPAARVDARGKSFDAVAIETLRTLTTKAAIDAAFSKINAELKGRS